MKQKIVCDLGKCVDLYNLSCEEKFDDIKSIIGCELLKKETGGVLHG